MTRRPPWPAERLKEAQVVEAAEAIVTGAAEKLGEVVAAEVLLDAIEVATERLETRNAQMRERLHESTEPEQPYGTTEPD